MGYRILTPREAAILDGLEPVWRRAAAHFVDELQLRFEREMLASVIVVSGRRDYSEQLEIWQQGRELISPDHDPLQPLSWRVTGQIRTLAFPGLSAHNSGLALDVALIGPDRRYLADRDPLWREIGEIAEQEGLEWGGRWRIRDYGHVQAKHWREIKR